MRFMMMVIADENFGAAGPPPQALMEDIDKLGQDAAKAGKMVSMGGLRHSSSGARIKLQGGKLSVVDGPFTESKEVIGGFTIMDLPSKEAAIEEARKFMELHRKHWPKWNGVCEIQQMYDEGDHP